MHVCIFEDEFETLHVIACENAKRCARERLRRSNPCFPCGEMDCFASLAMTWRELCHTGSAIEYFTWLSAKLDSIEAIPSSLVSLFFRNAS